MLKRRNVNVGPETPLSESNKQVISISLSSFTVLICSILSSPNILHVVNSVVVLCKVWWVRTNLPKLVGGLCKEKKLPYKCLCARIQQGGGVCVCSGGMQLA